MHNKLNNTPARGAEEFVNFLITTMVLCPSCWDEVNREVKQVWLLSHRKKPDFKILHDRTVVSPWLST